MLDPQVAITDTRTSSVVARSEPAFWFRFGRSRKAVIGSNIVTVVVILALAAPLLAPQDPTRVSILATWAPPDARHLLGTDGLGRDVLSRLLYGARISLLVASSVLAVTMTFGVAVGMVAAWYRGLIDGIIMRAVDVTFGFAELAVALVVVSVIGVGTTTVIMTLSLVHWPGVARLSRALVLGLREEPFIEAAIACGSPVWRIMLRHLLPNIAAPMIIRASLGFGLIVLAEATLSFLGLGVQEPFPSWGSMIGEGLPHLRTDPHLALSGSIALGLTTIGFNLLGDGLRDVLDPRGFGDGTGRDAVR